MTPEPGLSKLHVQYAVHMLVCMLKPLAKVRRHHLTNTRRYELQNINLPTSRWLKTLVR